MLCVEKAERTLYSALLPLYFPASKAEEEAAIWHLPADIGGPLGEPVVDPERQIRIIQNPRHDAMNGGKYGGVFVLNFNLRRCGSRFL